MNEDMKSIKILNDRGSNDSQGITLMFNKRLYLTKIIASEGWYLTIVLVTEA